MKVLFVFLVIIALFIPACNKSAPTAQTTEKKGSDKIDRLIKKHVENKENRKKMILLAAENHLTFNKLKGGYLQMTDDLRTNPKLTRQEADEIVAGYRNMRADVMGEITARNMEMRTLATEQEWNNIYSGISAKAEKIRAQIKKKKEKE